jgi:hypothetical protein
MADADSAGRAMQGIFMPIFSQLDPSIPMICPHGRGRAISRTDLNEHHNVLWEIVLDATGQIWTYPNPLVRVQANVTAESECEWSVDADGNVVDRVTRRVLYRDGRDAYSRPVSSDAAIASRISGG